MEETVRDRLDARERQGRGVQRAYLRELTQQAEGNGS